MSSYCFQLNELHACNYCVGNDMRTCLLNIIMYTILSFKRCYSYVYNIHVLETLNKHVA